MVPRCQEESGLRGEVVYGTTIILLRGGQSVALGVGKVGLCDFGKRGLSGAGFGVKTKARTR